MSRIPLPKQTLNDCIDFYYGLDKDYIKKYKSMAIDILTRAMNGHVADILIVENKEEGWKTVIVLSEVETVFMRPRTHPERIRDITILNKNKDEIGCEMYAEDYARFTFLLYAGWNP